MRINRLTALLLSTAMVTGVVTSCNLPAEESTTVSETTETVQTETTVTETTAIPDDLEGYKELSVADVTDEDEGKIMIYGYNSEFVGLAEKYAGITTNDYSFIEV